MTRPAARHPRCGGTWRGPFHTDRGAVLVCNTCGKETDVPNSPRPGVKGRNVRVPDELWEAAKIRAAGRGETVTDVIRRALERYTRRP